MVVETAVVKKWGNSLGLLIKKKSAKRLALSQGEEGQVEITKKKLVSGFGVARGAKPFKREIEEREF